MQRWAGKVAVVTGASAGIGSAIAKALVRNDMTVVGLSLREKTNKPEECSTSVSGFGKFHERPCDVSDENQVKEAFNWVEKKFESVHVLVNNAGCLKYSTIADLKTEDMKNIINVNLIGLLHCTRQALRIMKKNNHEAHIVNLNSYVGHKVPDYVGLNVYPSTKHAVTAISATLIQEIAGDKIRVSSISPGYVQTDIFDTGNVDPKFMENRPMLCSEDIANSVLHVISAPPHVQISELIIKPLGQVD